MTPVLKHTGKRVFMLADTLRFFMFPPQPLQGKRNTFFYMFATDFRFRNHVFPQSLTCVYVAETRNSLPETCFFVPSSGGNVKIQSGNLTGFSVFPAVSVSHLRKPSFPIGIFLHSYMKSTFSLYKSDQYVTQ